MLQRQRGGAQPRGFEDDVNGCKASPVCAVHERRGVSEC